MIIRILAICLLLLPLGFRASAPDPFDCNTALVHKHDQLRIAEITVTSWVGCQMNGTIPSGTGTTSVSLFADPNKCDGNVADCLSLRAKMPGKIRIQYDLTCGQVTGATDGPVAPTCAALPSPTPSPTQTPSPGTAVTVQGFVFSQPTGGVRVPNATVQVKQGATVLKTAQADTQAFFSIPSVPIGSMLTAVVTGMNFTPVTVTATGGNYFIYGGAVAPSPSPTPSSTPTPVPSPTATPTPEPSPPIETYEFARFDIPSVANLSDPVEIRNLLNSGQVGGAGYSQCFVVVSVTKFRCLRLRGDAKSYQWQDTPWRNGNNERDALITQIGNAGFSSVFVWQGSVWASKPRL